MIHKYIIISVGHFYFRYLIWFIWNTLVNQIYRISKNKSFLHSFKCIFVYCLNVHNSFKYINCTHAWQLLIMSGVNTFGHCNFYLISLLISILIPLSASIRTKYHYSCTYVSIDQGHCLVDRIDEVWLKGLEVS